jgi:hypothetical protein
MSTERSPEEIPDAIPVSEQRHPRAACPHCGGDDLSRGLKLGLSNEVGEVGIKYHATGKFLGMSLLGNEPLHVDFCNSCGTVTRIYLRETERKWS